MRLALLAAAAGVAAAVAVAADVSGKWTASIPGMDGAPVEQNFVFKADGETLTGSVSMPMGEEQPISEGKAGGGGISFVLAMEFGGQKFRIHYKGTVSGDEIKFVSSMEGGDFPPMEFTARRVK